MADRWLANAAWDSRWERSLGQPLLGDGGWKQQLKDRERAGEA